MRIFLVIVLFVAPGILPSPQAAKQNSPRYEPPAVILAADVAYPLQSVASGTVVLEVALDETGKISDVRVVRGIDSLTEPAERSVRQWKFQAAKIDESRPPRKSRWRSRSCLPPSVPGSDGRPQ